jgi:hypothetical protein
VKIPVRCGVFDGGRRCARPLGAIERAGFPGPEWFRGGDYDRLEWSERHWICPKHGSVQIHEAELLHEAMKSGRRRRQIMATHPSTWDRP